MLSLKNAMNALPYFRNSVTVVSESLHCHYLFELMFQLPKPGAAGALFVAQMQTAMQ